MVIKRLNEMGEKREVEQLRGERSWAQFTLEGKLIGVLWQPTA